MSDAIRMVFALAMCISLSASVKADELIDFEQPLYSQASSLSDINGQNGWTANVSMGEQGWVVFHGESFNATQVLFNNAAHGATATASRVFAEPTRQGTLTYNVRPSGTGTGLSHWLVLTDVGQTAVGLQLRLRENIKTNTRHEFQLIGAGEQRFSPDIEAIEFGSGDAWYEIRIDFNLDDYTAGINGTFDLKITRLDGKPQVVWSVVDAEMVSALTDIGKFVENGSFGCGGHATLIDDIRFVAEFEASDF